MEYGIYIATFLLGTIIGSFLNVIILRLNTGRSVVRGRSGCANCGHVLQWYELIPIVSFVFQKGRCRACNTKLSWQYPIVEFLTGILFIGIFLRFPFEGSFEIYLLSTIYYLLIISILIIIAVYDIYHMIIPNALVYTFIVLSFISLFIFEGLFVLPSLPELLAGPLIALPFALLWLVSQGRWMGFGDAKLALGIGWFLGITLGLSALVWAFWIGAVYSLLAIAIQNLHRGLSSGGGRFTMKSEIPFAPFLIVGFLLLFFFESFSLLTFLSLF